MGFLNIIKNLFKQEQKEIISKEEELIIEPLELPEEIVIPEQQEIKILPTRKFRLTYYWLAEQNRYSGEKSTPVFDKSGNLLDYIEPAFFATMSLQGTGKMRSEKLFNVASTWVKVKHEDYSAVWEYHKKYLGKRSPGYSGLVVENDKVVSVMSFRIIPLEQYGKGYGTIRGIPLEPFKTLAADIGVLKSHEPNWKWKGGICPPGTKVFIEEFVGKILPDETVHDGWFIVNDTRSVGFMVLILIFL